MKSRFLFAIGSTLAITVFSTTLFAGAADIIEKKECNECHGKNGVSSDLAVPTIAGESAPYIHDALMAYKEKERPGVKYKEDGKETDMNEIVSDMSEADINAVAEFYAAQTYQPQKQAFDAAMAAKGKKKFKKKCDKCHADGGTDPSDDAGILGGQGKTYLEHQFTMFSEKTRPMPKKMKKKFKKLNEADMKNIVEYLISVQ